MKPRAPRPQLAWVQPLSIHAGRHAGPEGTQRGTPGNLPFHFGKKTSCPPTSQPMQGGDRLIDVSAQQRSPTPFKSPLAAMAASFALGIAWAHSFHATVGIPWFLAGAGTSILVGLILLRAEWDKTAICMVLLGMTFTGVAAARRWEHRFPLNHIRNLESLGANVTDPVRLTGRVISTPYRAGYGMQFDVEAQRIESGGHVYPVIGKIRLRLQELDDRVDPVGGSHEIAFGDVIQTSTRLRPPHVYQNPGSFDFREWMEDIEDLYWVGTVKCTYWKNKMSNKTQSPMFPMGR